MSNRKWNKNEIAYLVGNYGRMSLEDMARPVSYTHLDVYKRQDQSRLIHDALHGCLTALRLLNHSNDVRLKTKVSEGRKRLSDEVQLANDAKQWVEAIQEYANRCV